MTADIKRYTGDSEGKEWDYIKHINAVEEPEVVLKFTDSDFSLKRIRESILKSKLYTDNHELK